MTVFLNQPKVIVSTFQFFSLSKIYLNIRAKIYKPIDKRVQKFVFFFLLSITANKFFLGIT